MVYRNLSFILVLIGFIFVSTPGTVYACGCPIIEPDAAYRQAGLIFTGTVKEVISPTRNATQEGQPVQIPEGQITRFVVEEYFKGTGDAQLELRGNNTSCDVHFIAGKQYLVYASRNPDTGALGAFACSRTRLLDAYARPDLNYLRRAVRGEQPTMLYGFVFRSTGESKLGESEPLSGLAVILEGGGKRLELKTDANGYFEAFDLPSRSYRVHTSVTGKLRGAEEKEVELVNSGVTSVTFHTTTMGSLSGRVVDQEGKPVNELQVQILLAKRVPGSRLVVDYDDTGEDGKFAFNEIKAGQYILAVNFDDRRSLYGAPFLPSYFPNAASSAEAQVITITDGVPIELGDFVLQKRYPTVAINGVVVTPDGKPVPGAYVYLDQSGGRGDTSRPVQTDADGHFIQQGFEGLTYTLRANADDASGVSVESDRVEVTAVKNARQVRLIVKLSK